MKLLPGILFLFFLSSCLGTQVPATHCTPGFTDKNQVMLAASAGASGFSGSAAYTPVKYFGLAANIQNFGGTNKRDFHTYVDGALAGYMPWKECTGGAMIGYGRGSYNWSDHFGSGDITHADGNYQKLYVLLYGVFHVNDVDIVPSIKVGQIIDRINYVDYGGMGADHNYTERLNLYELYCSIKEKPVRWFSFTAGAGFSLQGRVNELNSPLTFRLGVEFNLSKKKQEKQTTGL